MRGLSQLGLALCLTLGAALAGCAAEGPAPDRPPRASGSTSPTSTPNVPGDPRLVRLLASARLAPRTFHEGYDRSCTAGSGCVFGPEWTDDHPGLFGHNGCDTRQDVLLAQMVDIEMRWESDCRIYEAALSDPYTGERLTWRDDGYGIQIDHIYPLAAAWHAGAWSWPQARRVRFANDVRRELLAVSGAANQIKQASTPADWLPSNRAYRCTYVRKYLAVAAAYDLPISPEDHDAIARVATRCSAEPRSRAG